MALIQLLFIVVVVVFLFCFWVDMLVETFRMADRKGKNPIAWVLYCIFLSPMVVFFLYTCKDK